MRGTHCTHVFYLGTDKKNILHCISVAFIHYTYFYILKLCLKMWLVVTNSYPSLLDHTTTILLIVGILHNAFVFHLIQNVLIFSVFLLPSYTRMCLQNLLIFMNAVNVSLWKQCRHFLDGLLMQTRAS